ncbi:MAG: AAA family ATPase, partial [Halobacteriota archaeon]
LDFFWVEKYRPRSFEEILGQPVVKVQLQQVVDTKNLPNLLFFGPPGTGKSSAAEVVARELFGDAWEGNFTELNAADIFEQGRKYLEASRSLARFYDERKGVLDNFKLIMNRLAGIAPLGAPYRILFINEAESLTRDAQQALRRIIERYNKTCKFILATARPSQIIIPVRSRCLPLHFSQLPTDTMLDFLRRIATEEGHALSDECNRSIVGLSEGNLRTALTLLQLVADDDSSEAHPLDLSVLAERVHPQGVSELLQLALQNDAPKARHVLDRLLLETGLSGGEIIAQMRIQARLTSLSEKALAELLVVLGDAEYALLDALNERIQLEALIYDIAAVSTSS